MIRKELQHLAIEIDEVHTHPSNVRQGDVGAICESLKAQFEGLNKSQRERAIKDALAARGVNTKIASFIPQDIDPTEESVSKWLESNADVFGIQSTESQQAPNIDPAQAKQYQRLTNAAEQGNTPNAAADIMQKLLNANSREELDDVIRQSGL